MIFRDYFKTYWGDGANVVHQTQAFNAFFRENDQNINYGSTVKEVFNAIDSYSDEELLMIKGLGIRGVWRLRTAAKEWKQNRYDQNFVTRFNDVSDDWKRVKNHCRTTVNKKFTDTEPNEAFKRRLLISEHSPIRLLEVDWSWDDIPSWVATHWVRHKFEKFVSTQRDDRKEHDISRADMPQGTPVNFDGFANMQSLIDAWRKRLCHQASPETRKLAEDFKMALHEVCPEMADVLVPNCVYRCGCPEFTPCGWFHAIKWPEDIRMIDIQERYAAYNKWFYENR